MSKQALEIGAERRREVALETMRAARASDWRVRKALGAALVVFGNWIAGENAVARPKMRVTSERV